MGRLVCMLFALALVACAKAKSQGDNGSALSRPEDCTVIGAVTHDFREYGTVDATEYACTVPEAPAGMGCLFYEGANGERELRCLSGNASFVRPSGCAMVYFNGWRNFFSDTDLRPISDGNSLKADGYFCPSAYSLKCALYEHGPDSDDANYYQDFQCSN